MNAERLLAHYEKIADAPDAIARLRRFILDLAVRGKLVSRDPNDEPASELLKRIAKEKARLVKVGDFREPTTFVRIDRDALPFTPASHWAWARLIEIARPSYGFAFASDQFNSSKCGMPLIRIRDISSTDTDAYFEGDYDPAYLVTAGDYLVGMDGDFNLRCWRGVDGLLNQRVMRINAWRCDVDPEFVKLPLQFILDHLHGQTSLTTVKHLSAKQVNGIEIPLPPLAEQHRIVAKVDELMVLCDRLEAAREAREATRDRLAAASLGRLNAPDPETFQADARFALEALPALTARPDQIKALRQTILNLAVRGKLVPQDPKDEPVLDVGLKIKSRSRGQVQASIDPPFGLAACWAWRAVDTIADQVTDGEHATPSRILETQVPLVTAKNVRDGFMDYSQTDWVSIETAQKAWGRCRPQVGDLLLVCVGATTGRLTVLREPKDMVLVRSVALIRPNSDVHNEYLERAIRSPVVQQQIWASVKAAAQPCLYINRIQSLLVPLPPLAEQHRIVAKVDELMALCDRLEAGLATAANTRRRLLDALLSEALSPIDSREMEAAE